MTDLECGCCGQLADEELPVVAVRTKYENSPYGWSYTEDERFAKDSDCKREKLTRLDDAYEFGIEMRQLGMERMRRRVLNLIEEMKQEVKGTRLHSADVVEAFNQLREEVEQRND